MVGRSGNSQRHEGTTSSVGARVQTVMTETRTRTGLTPRGARTA